MRTLIGWVQCGEWARQCHRARIVVGLMLLGLVACLSASAGTPVTMSYHYDAAGRLVSAQSQNGLDITIASYQRDRAGNLLVQSVVSPVFADGFEPAPASAARAGGSSKREERP